MLKNNFFKRYRSLLEDKVPELFSGKYRVITEFGRSLLLKAGKSLTRINYIKDWLPNFVKPICLTHLGTNQFVRAVYLPQVWGHRLSALDGKTGESKTGGETFTYDIAGPLCFQVNKAYTRTDIRKKNRQIEGRSTLWTKFDKLVPYFYLTRCLIFLSWL